MNRARDDDNDGSIHQYNDSESQSNSPTGMMGGLGGNHSVGKCAGSSTTSSSFSCGSSVGCCSGSTTEVEEGDDGCLDDWEAVADALAANDKPPQNPPLGNVSENENAVDPLSQGQLSTESDNPGIEHVGHVHMSAPTSNQAWTPDDTSRPPSLPNLSKQYSLPIYVRHCGNGAVLWAHSPSAPSSCPICYEDLDKTDSSFLPCLLWVSFVPFSATSGSSRKTVVARDVDSLIKATQWRSKFAWRHPDTAVGTILQHGNQDIRCRLLFCRISRRVFQE